MKSVKTFGPSLIYSTSAAGTEWSEHEDIVAAELVVSSVLRSASEDRIKK